jgi:hypothetical protein
MLHLAATLFTYEIFSLSLLRLMPYGKYAVQVHRNREKRATVMQSWFTSRDVYSFNCKKNFKKYASFEYLQLAEAEQQIDLSRCPTSAEWEYLY